MSTMNAAKAGHAGTLESPGVSANGRLKRVPAPDPHQARRIEHDGPTGSDLLEKY